MEDEGSKMIVHKVVIDEFISADLKIPEVLTAMELKALMVKANKLFNLSDISGTVLSIPNTKQYNTRRNKWTPEQIQFLKDNYQKMSPLEMSSELGISNIRISSKIFSLGLRKGKTQTWTPNDVSFLLKNKSKMSYAQIAKKLGRNHKSVEQKYRRLIGK